MQNNGDDKNKLPDKPSDDKTPENLTKSQKIGHWFKKAWRAWCDWWKLTYESYVVEVEDRILMSWKRIIKFLGITIIPILYGVICSIAMWNPVEGLGKATTYVMDDDYSVLLVTDSDQNTGKFDFGAVSYFNNSDSKDATIRVLTNGTGLTADDIVFDPILGSIGIKNSALKNDMDKQKKSAIIFHNAIQDSVSKTTADFHLANEVKDANGKTIQDGSDVLYSPEDAGFTFQIGSTWDVIKSAFNKKTDPNADDRKYKFSAPAFLTHPEVSLQNVHYSSDKEWNDKYYQKPKGWIQAMIPEGYTSKVVNYVSLMMQNAIINSASKPDAELSKAIGDQLRTITSNMKPLGLWTTYEKNGLFGYMFDMMSGLLGQYIATKLPYTLNTAVIANLSQYLTTDGPTLASLTGGLNSISDNEQAFVPDGKGGVQELDMSQRYLTVDANSLTSTSDSNNERLKNASLFGAVTKGPSAKKSDVGGKLINTLETAKNWTENGGLTGLLGMLGGQGATDSINKLVKSIQGLIQQIIDAINGNSVNSTYDSDKGTITYDLNDITFKTTPADADLLKEFKLMQIVDPNDPTKNTEVTPDSAKFTADDGTPNTGTVEIVFKAPAQTDKDQVLKYQLAAGVGADNNMSWTQPIIAKIPAKSASNSKSFVTQPVNLSKQNTYETALVTINYAVYQVTTGQMKPSADPAVDKTIKIIWKALGLSGDAPTTAKLAHLQGVDIFKNPNVEGGYDNILLESDFDKRCDKFIAANSDAFYGAKTVNDVIPNMVSKKASDAVFGLSVGGLVTYKIQGAEFGYEGIIIGLFFLTVGLYVGTMLHSFIFDRAKRLTKSKWSNWYFSKYMLMLTIAFFQVTAEVWIIYAAGWHVLGAGNMCFVWLWLLSSDWMFVTIIQALWFSLKDEIIGKFLMVIVLVTSIAAGGGEFPAFAEWGFFHGISYVVPFTYVIKGFDEIVFGISGPLGKGTNAWSTNYVFQQFGIELIYIAIFLTLGMVLGAQLRMKEMNYGSHYGFAVAGAMRALGKDTSEFQVLRKVTRKGKKRYYYNWKSLPDGFMPELYFQCRRMYKFAGEFKWWQRKHHDFVQKPNYSDEEIIQRNE